MSPISRRPPWKLLLVALPLCFYLAFELGYSSMYHIFSTNNYHRSLETLKQIKSYVPSYQNFEDDVPVPSQLFNKSSDFPNNSSVYYQSLANQPKQLDWQPVSTSKDKFSVYSAYSYDSEKVIIISTARTNTNESITCVFHYKSDNEIWESTEGRIENMDENWGLNYTGAFVHCRLPSKSAKNLPLPYSVSVIAGDFNKDNDKEPTLPTILGNVLKIKYTSLDDVLDPPFNFSVCVLPAYNYNEVLYFLEWMEYYKLMGVQHFTLYNVSIGPSTSCILRHLMEDSKMNDSQVKVVVHPWKKFPIKSTAEIRASACAECGLSPGGNDCLYRHKGLAKYMSLVDFDEYIVPRTAGNFEEMISFLDAVNTSIKVGEYSFHNGFYPRARANDKFAKNLCEEFRIRKDFFTYKVCKQLMTVKKVARQEELLPYHQRTKYFVRPEAAIEIGNHHVIKLKLGYKTLVTPQEIAFLHHYRKNNAHWTLPDNAVLVPDRMPKNLAVELAKNTARQVDKFIKKCELDFDTVFSQNDK
ncbi:unnamed protein product [Orchesella dallaii]|uniref:Glycosyltransferase family 92 protein n=1 Tax=Orchesella dallaii TaxID=48710 RepID=A0ABP1RAU9_9HEXA